MNNNNDDQKWFNLVTDSDKNNRKINERRNSP